MAPSSRGSVGAHPVVAPTSETASFLDSDAVKGRVLAAIDLRSGSTKIAEAFRGGPRLASAAAGARDSGEGLAPSSAKLKFI